MVVDSAMTPTRLRGIGGYVNLCVEVRRTDGDPFAVFFPVFGAVDAVLRCQDG